MVTTAASVAVMNTAVIMIGENSGTLVLNISSFTMYLTQRALSVTSPSGPTMASFRGPSVMFSPLR